MKIQWYWPDKPLPYLRGTLVAEKRKSVIHGCTYISLHTSEAAWQLARIDFDGETAEEQDQLAYAVLAAAEIRVADFKEKHGVAV